jgi:drug/metabolite transporter superfamily protein YnfA
MLSLRSFHLFFILAAIVGADLFGVWAVWFHMRENDPLILALGIGAILGGLGLIFYAVRLVRSLDRAQIH